SAIYRKKRPFITVNCGAIPEGLIESELFGHKKGAFTGAVSDRIGKFEAANNGTLFLDEIGELSMLLQVKLLRAIQEKEVTPVGANNNISVNVRIITATNRNLEEEVAKGNFRADLYYRLNVFQLFLPPLRERGSDIMLLADHFIKKYSNQQNKNIERIDTPAIDMLMAYHWPGNVRELENCIERACLLAKNNAIHSRDLPPSLQMKSVEETLKSRGKFESLVRSYEIELITDALKDAQGNQSKAAELLQTTKRIIQYKISQYNIDCKRFSKKQPDSKRGF
nr:sigma-54 dependent transcriptional regulator [Spirochaetota bacterium]